MNVSQRQLQIVGAFYAVVLVILKWLVGVVARKLIEESVGKVPLLAEPAPLWDVVFLKDFSFGIVAGLSFAATFLCASSSAALAWLASLRSTESGRNLRKQILERAVSSPDGGTETDVGYIANELILKVKVIENYQAFDEYLLLVHQLILGLAFVLSICFAWYGGLVAFALFLGSCLSEKSCAFVRSSIQRVIEANDEVVNARLLDVIKNGVKIKVMGRTQQEASDLRVLEKTSDEFRMTDAKMRFCRDVMTLSQIGIVPVMMAFAALPIIQKADIADALNKGFAVLVAILLLDEGMKSLIFLTFVSDRSRQATEAQLFIDNFLHPGGAKLGSDSNPSSLSKCTNDTDVERVFEMEKPFSKSEYPFDGTKEIMLNGITLTYPHRQVPALLDYSQVFERGKIHGLVGESGAGKSSMLMVLADMVTPQQGHLTAWIGMKAAYVNQDQKLFARTIRENITYGAAYEVNDEDAWAALREANLFDWVSSLPLGLEEQLDDGEGMVSGGQLQRLHLAHLFCTCKNADLVLLDEVLSAVDQNSRNALIDRLGEFLRGKTSIIITHHSEMLRICDEVHSMVPSSVQNIGAMIQVCGRAHI